MRHPWRKIGRQAELHDLLEQLKRSQLGRWLLRQAAWRGVLVCLDDATTFNGYYRSGRRMIGVRSGLDRGQKAMFLAHELAHVIQHPRFSNNRFFPPHQMILLHRMRESAAEAVATRVVWQLREAGDEAPWVAKMATRYSDIAASFAAEMAADHGPQAERRAARAAFAQWFRARWRLNFYDRLMINHLERISQDPMGLVLPRRQLSDNFLRSIGWLEGENYLHPPAGPLLAGEPFDAPLSQRNTAALGAVLIAAYGGTVRSGGESPYPATSAQGVQAAGEKRRGHALSDEAPQETRPDLASPF